MTGQESSPESSLRRAESKAEARVALDRAANATQLLLDRVAATPDAELFARRTDAGWESVSAAAFLEAVRALAKGLVASGLDTGDRVAIISASTYEWAVVDFAVWFAGGVPVPVYETSSPQQIAWILEDSGARRAFVQDAALARTVQDAIHGSPSLSDEWLPLTVMADDGEGATLRSLTGPGLGVGDAELERHRSAATLDDLATLVYTSGTTGRPKACEITHGNLADLALNLAAHLPSVVSPGARTLMFLPLAHVLARAVQVTCVAAGVVVGHSRQATLLEDLASFQPTFLLAVPRVFEKVYARAQDKAASGPFSALFERAAHTARAYSMALDDAAAGRSPGPSRRLRLRHALFDRLVYARLREAFGDHVSTIVSGASPLSPSLAHFFRGAGLTVLEGYGLTETTAPCTVNTPEATRIGTVGRPVPGTAIRISASGEVLVAGIGVFRGYRGPDGTSAPFDADGFFPTGDLGSLDSEGFLTITGRTKDLLVTSGGKNVVPGPLEEAIRESEIVAHAVVVGEGRPFVAALIALDADGLALWAKHHGRGLALQDAPSDPDVLAEVQRTVDAANAQVSRAEAVRKFVILPRELTLEDGDLTPSLKLRRAAVSESFGAEIDGLYAG